MFENDQSRNDYITKHYIPNVDLNILNFKEFIEKRNDILKNELSKRLK